MEVIEKSDSQISAQAESTEVLQILPQDMQITMDADNLAWLVATGQRMHSVVDVLRLRAEHQADHIAFIHLVDGETIEQKITYGQLYQRATEIAAALALRQPVGKRVLMLFESGLDYIVALFATFMSGAIAVPSFPPIGSRALQRLASITADASPQIVLTNQRFSRMQNRLLPALGDSFVLDHWLDIDELPSEAMVDIAGKADAQTSGHVIASQDLALLQYTSGSTGSPKGVMLTHGNLLSNCHFLGADRLNHQDGERVGCSWLPPYHDMGLMGGILQPVYEGFPTVILAPGHFVQRPSRWLLALTRYRVTTTVGPNFAFDLCVDNIPDEDAAQFDLSTVKLVFCGAEPVRKSTFDRFMARFSRFGFRPQAFRPCYGLAEATLYVTGTPVNTVPTFLHVDKDSLAKNKILICDVDAPNAVALASCGSPSPGQTLRIVDPHTAVSLADGLVGEIWVSAANTGLGYWNKPEASNAAFFASLDGESAHFMRTGDLGFLRDGQLYVTGRLKDLIIVAGRNLYPQDIELCVEAVDQRIRANGVVAFSIDDGVQEQIAIVAEIRRHEKFDQAGLDALRINVVESVTATYGAAPHIVHFAPPTAIPLTTSGKLQRQATKLALLNGSLASFKVEA